MGCFDWNCYQVCILKNYENSDFSENSDFRWGAGVSVVQPLTCLLFPYLAYLIAESFGLSGILAIVVCGMGMKQYIVGNISEQSLVTVNYFMKTLSSRFGF